MRHLCLFHSHAHGFARVFLRELAHDWQFLGVLPVPDLKPPLFLFITWSTYREFAEEKCHFTVTNTSSLQVFKTPKIFDEWLKKTTLTIAFILAPLSHSRTQIPHRSRLRFTNIAIKKKKTCFFFVANFLFSISSGPLFFFLATKILIDALWILNLSNDLVQWIPISINYTV